MPLNSIAPSDLNTDDLAAALRGTVLTPRDDGYDAARRIWNGRFDHRPAAIVQCADGPDVVATVNFARERDLLLAVKGGGHSYAGKAGCDGCLLLDLSRMDGVRIETESRSATVQPAATWGEFDRRAQAHGLATPGGTVSTVGVAGLTLGGGSGYLTRKHGLTIDNLLAAEVVTADGRLLRASQEEHPDLFWALRGGGGNFGVVTSFEFRLHEVGPEVLAGQIMYPFSVAPDALRLYRDSIANAPNELTCYAFVLRVPPIPAFPEEFHGELAIDFVFCYAGDVFAGEEVIRPLLELGEPILAAVAPQPYTAVQQAFDEGLPAGQRYYSRAQDLAGLPDEAIETVVRCAEGMVGPYTVFYFCPDLGAASRIASSATAYPHPRSPLVLHVLAGWSEPADDREVMEWTRGFHDAMTPYATGDVYVNLLAEDEEERIPAAYGSNYERLVQLKQEWDPENFFRVNHNLQPRG